MATANRKSARTAAARTAKLSAQSEIASLVRLIISGTAGATEGWVRIGLLAAARPSDQTFDQFRATIAAACEAEGVAVPSTISNGWLSKAEKVAKVMAPAILEDKHAHLLREGAVVLYKAARAIEADVPGIDRNDCADAVRWVLSGGQLPSLRSRKSKDSKSSSSKKGEPAPTPDPTPAPEIDPISILEREALEMLRAGANAAGIGITEFAKRAVAAALAQ
jgi:hypothetical protein